MPSGRWDEKTRLWTTMELMRGAQAHLGSLYRDSEKECRGTQFSIITIIT